MNRQQLKIFLLKTVFGIVLLFFISGQCFSQIRSSKRGIAYGYHSEADMAVVSKGISWWYNWYYQPESMVATVYKNYGMDFVPMAWGKSFNEAGLRAFYASHPESKYLLGFNEPNFLSQANMKPSEAAAAWPKLEKIAKDFGLKIVGPAVNYSGDPVQENGVTYSNPIAYLDAFFAACPNCQVDYIAVHNYMCYSGALSDYINQFKKYNKPIWLTEFACWDQSTITLSMQKGLMMGAIDYLESDPMVFRYSWFTGNRSGNFPYIDLFDAQSGKLTELGELYINFNPVHNPDFYTTIPARIEAESYTTMSGTAIEATKDISGIANVGWIDAGDWLEYNIDVPANGDYTFYFRISANATTNFDLKVDDVLRENVQVATTGGWQNWKTLQTNISLSAGKHKVRIYTSKGMFNVNWLEIGKPGQPTFSGEIQNSTIRVYPNPATDKLFIEREIISDLAKVQILDLTGRILCEKLFDNQQFRLELECGHLNTGSYLVLFRDENQTGTRLFVKE